MRLQAIGVDPHILVGKTLTYVRRSPTHPSLTLSFSDGTSFRILVDGYDPIHRGVPKALEMDASLSALFDPPGGHRALNLPILDCTLVRLTDKAFERRQTETDADAGQRWDQSHLSLAFKFGDARRWHCVWATLEEHDAQRGACVFRSFDDVYLERIDRDRQAISMRSPASPRKRRMGPADGMGWR